MRRRITALERTARSGRSCLRSAAAAARGASRPVRVIEPATSSAFAVAAADWVCGHLGAAPASVLALPTGNTPLGLYAELTARSRAGAVRLDRARIFNLDEYCGLGPADPHSFASYMQRHLISPLGLRPAQIRLLRGDSADMALECRVYDAALAECGGIDLCVLGLGANGHVAFNEPGTLWDLRTHVADLSESTRAAQRRPAPLHQGALDDWTVPDRGVTMGITTILESRHILLLIAGANKAAAAAALYRGVPSIDWPVTSLAAHPSLTVIQLCERAEDR
jgi:glucosamine-6-phosphate deaminase